MSTVVNNIKVSNDKFKALLSCGHRLNRASRKKHEIGVELSCAYCDHKSIIFHRTEFNKIKENK